VTVLAVLVAFLALQGTNNTSNKQQNLANKQQELANKQQDLAEQGQITDRFTRTIDQLGQEGDGKLAIRLGGIYALERIMRDARVDGPNPVDERNVVELLCAFIRAHTAKQGPVSPETGTSEPTTDVQAALTVLGRRANSDKTGFGADPKFGIVDLRRAHLEGARLEGAHMEGAHFEGAHLDRVHLEDAHLNGAHLGAVLDGKYVNGAVMNGAYLNRANLTDAHLEDSYIAHDTKMDRVNLTGAHLGAVHLGSDQDGVKLGADLSSTLGLKTENLQCALSRETRSSRPASVCPLTARLVDEGHFRISTVGRPEAGRDATAARDPVEKP
jgi:uncharacterized protein YjbI with pentapeptide repeats